MPLPSFGPLRKRFAYAAKFWEEETELARSVAEYLRTDRYRQFRRLLAPPIGSHLTLRAIDPRSRMIWARAFAESLLAFFGVEGDDDPTNRTIFFVTLISDVYAVADTEEPPNPLKLTSWARQMLNGFNCLGMIEPAYYTEFRAQSADQKTRFVSYHAHALVWGADKSEIRARLKDLNRKLSSAVPEKPAAHATRCASTADLTRRVFYLLKSPRKRYRVGIDERKSDNPTKQSKDKLRPAERLRIHAHMRNLYLDELAFAGGEGRQLLAGIKKAALKKL
jgi:hypothetical protein